MEQPRTLAEFPYVTVRIACFLCPKRKGRYRLARLAAKFGPEASLDGVLYALTRRCKWQVPPATKRRKYVPYCQAHFSDLFRPPPPDEPPDGEPPPPAAPALRLVG